MQTPLFNVYPLKQVVQLDELAATQVRQEVKHCEQLLSELGKYPIEQLLGGAVQVPFVFRFNPVLHEVQAAELQVLHPLGQTTQVWFN